MTLCSSSTVPTPWPSASYLLHLSEFVDSERHVVNLLAVVNPSDVEDPYCAHLIDLKELRIDLPG